MPYEHYFRCAACQKHVIYVTLEAVPVQPGATHGAALKGGAFPAVKKDAGVGDSCIGRLAYCSGFDKMGKPTCPPHPGTRELAPPPEPPANPDWTDFAGRVSAAWLAFVDSGYAPAKRGANNNREYKATPAVLGVLQSANGVVRIGGAVYVVSNSFTAGVSLHRPIPAAHQSGHMLSFIYHL